MRKCSKIASQEYCEEQGKMQGSTPLAVLLRGQIVLWSILYLGGAPGEAYSTAHYYDPSLITPTPSSPNKSFATSQPPPPTCTYTQWSSWAGECPAPKSCGGGTELRSREPAGSISQCSDITQERDCKNECVHVRATRGILVTEMIDNSAPSEDGELVDRNSILPEDVRYTYGSLWGCSAGCLDIEGLDRDHDIVCLMCTNEHTCGQLGLLRLNMVGKLDIIRNRRQSSYAVKVEGADCSCSFIPEFALINGLCSSPSYYINLTVK